MEQKDYKEIAKIIKKHYVRYLQTQPIIYDIVLDLSDYFEKENPLGYYKSGEGLRGFHRKQFLKDCGVE